MKYIFLLAALVFGLKPSNAQEKANVITTDITNFWNAYDKISTTKDSALQYAYLNELFINKGTPGLKAIIQARNYTAQEYLSAINRYPLLWNSIRANTYKANGFARDIAININKLKKLYPQLKPAEIYFTIGALRSGGTTLSNMVLIGSEISLADDHTITTELPESFSNLKSFFPTNPIKSVVFTNVHEYVHTQQKTTVCSTLLGQSTMEGVAEFMAVKATGQPSPTFGMYKVMPNSKRLREVFSQQMFNTSNGFWLYSSQQNEFGYRDLGYYVGYLMCKQYYNKAANKQQAIKQMIELDYNDTTALAQFANRSGYFDKSIKMLKAGYEVSRPTVTGIKPLKNGGVNIVTGTTQITIQFSSAMHKRRRNF